MFVYNKNPQQSGYRGSIPPHNIGYIYKSTDNIIPDGEKMKTFPLRSEKRKEYSLRPLPFNVVLEILATIIRQ